jgi:hypothetical protein
MSNTEVIRLERKIDKLLKITQPKKVWVKAGVITSMTIFNNNEKMREARDNGYVEFEKREDGFWYNLNSVHEKFFLK